MVEVAKLAPGSVTRLAPGAESDMIYPDPGYIGLSEMHPLNKNQRLNSVSWMQILCAHRPKLRRSRSSILPLAAGSFL